MDGKVPLLKVPTSRGHVTSFPSFSALRYTSTKFDCSLFYTAIAKYHCPVGHESHISLPIIIIVQFVLSVFGSREEDFKETRSMEGGGDEILINVPFFPADASHQIL